MYINVAHYYIQEDITWRSNILFYVVVTIFLFFKEYEYKNCSITRRKNVMNNNKIFNTLAITRKEVLSLWFIKYVYPFFTSFLTMIDIMLHIINFRIETEVNYTGINEWQGTNKFYLMISFWFGANEHDLRILNPY